MPKRAMCITSPTIASPARKPRMPAALRSCCSNSISSCLGSSLLMRRLQEQRGLRIVDRQQWPRLQVIKEVREPKPAHCHGDHDIEPVHEQLLVVAGLDEPEQIRKPHENNED